jgi:hypothetical protein
MEALKRKPVALLVTAVVVALSTLLSVNRTLGAACQRITDGFYQGVYVDGYRQPGISAHLQERLNLTNGITAVTSGHPALDTQTDAMKKARDHLLAATESAGIAAQYRYNGALQEAAKALRDAAADVEFSEREQKMLDTYWSDFDGAQAAIRKSAYNDTVREFYRSTLNVFPTKFLAAASGVTEPELFE